MTMRYLKASFKRQTPFILRYSEKNTCSASFHILMTINGCFCLIRLMGKCALILINCCYTSSSKCVAVCTTNITEKLTQQLFLLICMISGKQGNTESLAFPLWFQCKWQTTHIVMELSSCQCIKVIFCPSTVAIYYLYCQWNLFQMLQQWMTVCMPLIA